MARKAVVSRAVWLWISQRSRIGSMARNRMLQRRRPARHFIREWRKYRNLTLEKLAERVGVTHGALSQLERGEVNYTQPMLEALADALQCEPADLIMRDPNSEIWSVMDVLKAAPEAEQRQIAAIIGAFRKTG
jgi:transcriptional regulator with XRE-family HTH domain